MRKAKIVCTLGPASDSPEVLRGLLRAGMDVARLNFSHGTHAEHRRRIRLLRDLARREGRALAILQDVQGPKIRLGTFEGGRLEVTAGQRVTLTTRPVVGQGSVIPTPIRTLPRDVRKGDPVLLDDGRVRLRVLRVRGRDVEAEVEVGGLLKDRKGLNLPGSPLSVSTLTEKDRADLAFGQAEHVDYVALSFVRSARDVREARALLKGRGTPIIAKIEKPQAVENLEEVAREAEGVMVARGDLGVEMPLEQLPVIQKRIIQHVNRHGGLVIVATEMLESMIQNPRPTRAEVTDVANAVLDGADAVMLSGETAAGKHPVEAAAAMASIIAEVERSRLAVSRAQPFVGKQDISTGVAAAAVAAAAQLGIRTLVAYTERGNTARLISELRPEARILALTPRPETVRRMALYWGVEPKQVRRLSSTDTMLRQVRRLCREEALCAKEEPVVIVASVPLNQPGGTNLLTVHRI